MGRLETLTIVTTLLHMADRRTEQGGPVLLGNRQQGDFTVELDELFDNQLFDVATTAVAAIFTSDCPLPEEDINGFTTQGKPIFSAAVFSSSKDLA